MTRRHKILVIEDNEINREIVQEILEDNYDMFFAVNGREGLDLMREHCNEISVILLDIQMPVMNGFEVLSAKASDPLVKDIPVIVTTDSGDEIDCLKLGAQDFVHKPYNPVVMRLRIANIINLRESNEANHQKTMFIQNMNHEIRTPMNAIMGFAQIIEGAADSLEHEEVQEFCHNIIENSNALMGMIDNMVALSSFDSGLFVTNLRDFPLNDVCRDAMMTASINAQDGVKVYFTSDLDNSFVICSDEKLIRKVVFNFVTNACKFTSCGEVHVHCSSKEKEGFITISVSDTGVGIASDKAESVFGRFSKIDDFVPGMGLGLALVRKIAETLGCRTYLDTAYSGGARFVFEMPYSAR